MYVSSNNPLVSVCIGTYNRERYIRECLDSVFEQTYTNYEVIVVDDASTDSTVAIIRGEYGDRVRLVVRGENSGLPAVPRNEAAKIAKGEYLAFLDSDDLWLAEKLAVQVDYMQKNPAIDLCHGYCFLIDADRVCLGVRHEGRLRDFAFEDLLEHCFVCMSTVVIKRDVFENLGGLSESSDYVIGEDCEFFLRLARNAKLCLASSEPVACYRRSDAGITASDANWKRVPEDFLFYCLLIKRKDIWEGVIQKVKIINALGRAGTLNASYWRGRGQRKRGIIICLMGLRYAPMCPGLWVELAKVLIR